MKRIAYSLALGLFALAAAPAFAQEGMPPAPKPAPEHLLLAKDVGVWDATVKLWMAPGQPPVEEKGTETITMIGPFWQVGHFESRMMGEPFKGVGLAGWDAEKKVYVTSWVDSMTPTLSHGSMRYDAATRTLSGTTDGVGPDGKPTKTKAVQKWLDDDTRVFTMSAAGPDGKDVTMMEIRYKRRK